MNSDGHCLFRPEPIRTSTIKLVTRVPDLIPFFTPLRCKSAPLEQWVVHQDHDNGRKKEKEKSRMATSHKCNWYEKNRKIIFQDVMTAKITKINLVRYLVVKEEKIKHDESIKRPQQ
ncbi:hypothetical protein ACS0TY_028615 [Phlomoides rotata]